ncbi:protein gufA [Thermosipho melanesiensis]|uniref:Zinc/iron permease n=2 Tax=Thermosipho melanesiensis TaxID=46541 RepID=A6LLW1_THEM4|nr:ZIP family metal transporter [Thermosipho melanesiensis]ABR30912.1 zinc/iron permease [Thermosipho melanesiensis BI429]APT74031.1 protein gufA [Thermosipho melanesiensis]OOC35958.1 protein gufA [Thermosipho melanesiensis]OOC38460.1 protein gufA [Thermosipho melanesiensis]OOC38921.1 protein gufA [Thermosipho melanesiensis]
MNKVLYGIVLSTAAGMATSIGAIPFLFFRKKVTEKFIDALLGMAAGIMLAASAFSLVVPSIEIGGLWRFGIGFFLGAILVDLMDKYSPHEHFLKGHEGIQFKRLSKIWLFVIAITIHNLPEGMAVGVSSFSNQALNVAFAIGAQNIPEGAAVTAALLNAGYSVRKAFFISFLTGVVEILGGILGAGIVSISQALLPYMMAFAGGAMIFVISDEVIPETHLRGNERLSTYFLIVGFFIMSALDVVLG